MGRTKVKNGRIITVYLDERNIAMLDMVAGSNSLSRSSMIEVLVNEYCEQSGMALKSGELEKERLKKLEELKEIEEKQQKIRSLEPLVGAREKDNQAMYDNAISILIRKIREGTSMIDLERLARVHARAFLNNKYTWEELLSKAHEIIEESRKKHKAARAAEVEKHD